MKLAAAWLLATALFALGLVLADRWFWSSCSGFPTSRYADVWVCANVPAVRIAVALAAGLALVALAYRPPVAILPISGLLGGVASFMAPAMIGGVAGAKMKGTPWRMAL